MLDDATVRLSPVATPLQGPATPPPAAPPSVAERLAAAGDVQGASELIRRDPTQIDPVLAAFAEARPGLVPDLVAASAQTLQRREAPQEEPSVGNRIWGGLRALGGAVETVVGGALIVAPEPTTLTKIGGAVVGAHGIDNVQAGLRQVWTGQETETLTQQGVTAGAEAVGIDPATARVVGVGVDIGIGFVGSGAAALARVASGSKVVWNSIRATQPLHEGTAIPRSFELVAGSTKVWVHGNGTKHLAEFANAARARGLAPELVNLTSQVQLSSLQAAVRAAGTQGIQYETMMKVGGWELIFSPARAGQTLPVLKHALPIR